MATAGNNSIPTQDSDSVEINLILAALQVAEKNIALKEENARLEKMVTTSSNVVKSCMEAVNGLERNTGVLRILENFEVVEKEMERLEQNLALLKNEIAGKNEEEEKSDDAKDERKDDDGADEEDDADKEDDEGEEYDADEEDYEEYVEEEDKATQTDA